jgi:hypothetical protein
LSWVIGSFVLGCFWSFEFGGGFGAVLFIFEMLLL